MRARAFLDLLEERVLILDGAMGTMIQRETGAIPFQDCFDQFCLSRPEAIRSIHRQYLEAGADIICSNSFSANTLSLARFGLSDRAFDIALAAARLAREEAARFRTAHPERTVFVAGSVGPIQSTVPFSSLTAVYKSQLVALLEGGVDLLLFETVMDTESLSAGLEAVASLRVDMPILVSAAITDEGTLYSGESIADLVAAVRDKGVSSIGFNCSCGGDRMCDFVHELSALSSLPLSLYPNAGLPNADGEYEMSPVAFYQRLSPLLKSGVIRIVGGCCGTTPEFIRELVGL